MSKRDLPRHIRDIVPGVLHWSGLAGPQEVSEIAGIWAQLLPEEDAVRTRVVSLRGRKLQVEVDSSPLLFELASFDAARMLRELNRRLGRPLVEEIVFRLGTFHA